MGWKKPAIIASALVLAGTATAASAAAFTEPASAYGGCVSKSSGYLRVLERNNLSKSVNGACRSTERKITWFSRTGGKGPKGDTGPAGPAGPAPATLVLIYKGTTINCTKGTAATLTYECADAS